MRRTRRYAAVLALAFGAVSVVPAQQLAPDVILSNGKIITVDERFSVAQAVAIRGDRILAVGTDAEVAKLATPATRRIDLRGRSVIPGLIDNHMHLTRAGTTWQWEVRWDGVGSRAAALDKLRARAKAVAAGEWIYNLGGWAIEQFADDPRPFTREELDKVVPNNPVFLQASYYEAYLNSRGLQAMGIEDKTPANDWVVRDNAGHPTGRITEAGFRGMVGKLPQAPPAAVEASTLGLIRDLNRAGLTSFGVAGCDAELIGLYKKWAAEDKLNVRTYCINGVGVGNTAEQIDKALPRIAEMKLFQGDNYVDDIFYGESVYGPLHDPMFIKKSDPKPEQLALWKKIATEIAKDRLPLHVHANLTDTIDGFLDQIEAINKQYPIKNLRWVLAHVNQLNASQLARMRELGMYAASPKTRWLMPPLITPHGWTAAYIPNSRMRASWEALS